MKTWRKPYENRCKNVQNPNARNYTENSGVRKTGCIAAGAKISYGTKIAAVRAVTLAQQCWKTIGGAV